MLLLKTALILLSTSASHSLLVVPSSPTCASKCGNVLSNTTGSDITCDDSDYSSSAAGTVFKSCVGCEMTSKYVDPNTKQTDLQWGVYNMRYAVSHCLFGFDNEVDGGSSPCLTSYACAPLQNVFEHDSLSTNSSIYSFCPLMHENNMNGCVSCLRHSNNQHYLTNFIIALHAACLQQPPPGASISLDASVFSDQIVNITDPAKDSQSEYKPQNQGLTLGAKIGIIVGCLVVFLILLGCCIIWRGKRRRRATLARAQQQWYAASEDAYMRMNSSVSVVGGNMFADSPQSQQGMLQHQQEQRWGQGQGQYPGMPQNPGLEQTYFSPYSSQYNSPVSPIEAQTHVVGSWPRDQKMDLDLRIQNQCRNGNGETIEMVDVKQGGSDGRGWEPSDPTPVLMHPGMGRGEHVLTEDDFRSGRAL